MKFAGLFNQHHVDPRYPSRQLAKAVDSDALIPTKYVDGFIKQFFELWNQRDGRWGVNFRRAVFTFFWRHTMKFSPDDVVVVNRPKRSKMSIQRSHHHPCFLD